MTTKAGQRNRAVMTMTRLVDAPYDRVFEAWVTPDQFAQWWGPKGFTNPLCQLDVRAGGKILVHMTAPDGAVYPMTGTFLNIAAPHRLTFSAQAVDHDGGMQIDEIVVVSFERAGSQTKLTVHADAIGVAEVAPQMLAGMEAGWAQSLDRLIGVVDE